jgi:hypothetical protein
MLSHSENGKIVNMKHDLHRYAFNLLLSQPQLKLSIAFLASAPALPA